MPFSSLADTVSSSDAQRVATSSDALPSQDYMETDDFDTLDIPVFASSGDDTVTNTVDLSSVQMCLSYYDMAGVIRYKEVQLNKSGYASIPRPSDYASPIWFGFVLHKGALPSAGKYKMSVHFGSNTNIVYQSSSIWFGVRSNNVSQQESSYYADGYYSSGDFSLSTNLSIGASTSQLNISNFLAYDSPAPPYGGYVSINFTRLSSDASVHGGSPDSGNVDRDINQSISDNTAQQVAQGDTIIELIKNTIQTISSQLTSFWNQLAGEFTNLYNKMNIQHSEKMQSDQDTRDVIQSEEEKSRNFIVDGIINGLKSLFIPSDEYFKTWFDGMYQFFNDRLGFLMLPVDLLVRFADMYASAGSSSAGFPFPEFKWIDGTVLIASQTVQFGFLDTDWGQKIQTMLYFVGNLIMIGALLSLMHRKFEEVLRN